jgi:hypothetical protein
MMAIYKIKNASGADGTWVGQLITDGSYYTIQEIELGQWRADDEVFTSIGAGDLIVNSGTDVTDDITDVISGWSWLIGNHLPLSDLDGTKLAVHSSSKPTIAGTTYAVWAGAGDDIGGNAIGAGPITQFTSAISTAIKTVDVEFLSTAGRIWLHEGYLTFKGGGLGDYMSADVVAKATALQTSVDLDYEISSNWVKAAAGGAGTGTHGWAGTPVLIPRSFSKDGWWDYDGVTLTANATQTGGYHISDIERIAHRFFNRVLCFGDSYGYFTMSSDEATELPAGYLMRITQHNVSDTVWDASIVMEIYREKTVD